MRNFNWETLPKHSVLGKHNIWTADQPDGEYELDTDRMEELFSKKQEEGKGFSRQSIKGLPTSGLGAEIVTILSSKRSMNIGIFLKQFKRPVGEMIEDIKVGNYLSFGTGKLRELCKLLPDKDEMKQLKNFKGDHFSLPEADLFMLKLVKIPSYEERLSSLVLKEEFFPLMEELKGFIGTLITAGNELLQSDQLHSVIRLVLKTGNYMNAGGYAGSAVGFRMTSLLKLVDTKANKPGMNLMHYVVMQAQKVDPALLTFPDQLQHIEAAARMNKADIEAEFSSQLKNVQGAKEDSLKQKDLRKQMEDFLEEADVIVRDVEADLQELQSLSDSVAEYFCEDPNKFKLEECCSIFHSFCERFIRAIQENKAREVSEVKRRHAERLQTALKRRSIATCSGVDQELEGVTLESVLQSFIKRGSRRKSGRPFSTHGTPPNGSPVTGSLLEITSQNNHPKNSPLFKTKDMSRKEWNSAADLRGHMEKNVPKKVPMREDLKRNENSLTSISSRPISAIEDAEEDFEDNNEEEAQRLREASKKVLRFQSSRGGSVSSTDSLNEKTKSPIVRQRTIDEDLETQPDNLTNEDLAMFLANPQSPTKRNLGRRHTLPTKVAKTKENKDWTMSPPRTPKSAMKSPMQESPDLSRNLTNESEIHPNKFFSTEETLPEETQECKVTENSESIPPANAKVKRESMLFNLLKRFQFPTHKEVSRKSSDSSV